MASRWRSRRTLPHAASTPATRSPPPLPDSRPATARCSRRLPASSRPAPSAAHCPQAASPLSDHTCASLHLQLAALAGRHHPGLIHGPHSRRTHLERSRVHHLQQVEELLLPLRKVSLEQRHAIVVQLAAREIVSPPWRPALQLVQ